MRMTPRSTGARHRCSDSGGHPTPRRPRCPATGMIDVCSMTILRKILGGSCSSLRLTTGASLTGPDSSPRPDGLVALRDPGGDLARDESAAESSFNVKRTTKGHRRRPRSKGVTRQPWLRSSFVEQRLGSSSSAHGRDAQTFYVVRSTNSRRAARRVSSRAAGIATFTVGGQTAAAGTDRNPEAPRGGRCAGHSGRLNRGRPASTEPPGRVAALRGARLGRRGSCGSDRP